MENQVQTVEFNVAMNFAENLPKIISNIEEIIKWAKEQTEYDRTAIVTMDNIADAKSRATAINKVIECIDKKRKEVKKAYNAPYDTFEKKLKEATAVLTEARMNLWNQVVAIDQKEKEEKEARLKHFYEELVLSGNCITIKLWEKIVDPAWLNKGKSENAAKEDIRKIYEQQISDIAAIKALNGGFTVELIRMYMEDNKTLGEIIQANNYLLSMKQQKTEEKNVVNDDGEKFRLNFFVEGTKEQIAALKEFLKANNIKYGKIQ